MKGHIKNLMFDLGGVIMDIRRENAVEALEKIGLANADELLGKYGQKGIFLALERGDVTPSQFRDALRREINGSVTDDRIDEAFSRFLIGIPVDRLHQLEELGKEYRVYLLSNTNAIMWNGFIAEEFKKDGHDIDYYFDGTIASFDVHAYKPDADIFDKATSKFGINPGETLFFDDSTANVEAARRLGFKAVHVTDGRPFRQYIENIETVS